MEHANEAFDARRVVEQLLVRVKNEETVVIRRHGARVANLVPYEGPIDEEVVDQTIRDIENLLKDDKLFGLKLRELIEDGRRR